MTHASSVQRLLSRSWSATSWKAKTKTDFPQRITRLFYKAFRLFKKGHVRNIELAVHARHVFFSAQCVPEMRSDRTYFLKIAVATNGKKVVEVLYAQGKRGPAGKEP